MSKDLYSILGIDKNATDSEIKRAFRKKAQKYHPDRNPNNKEAEQNFKDVNMAYEVLSDKQKRSQYDNFGSTDGSPFGAGGFGQGGFDFSSFQGGGGGFADIFESFFGGAQTQRGPKKQNKRGNDIETTISISFEEAVSGVEKELEVTKLERCETCDGKGAAKGSKISNCNQCSGTGSIQSIKQTILGQIRTSTICPDCNGEGQVPEKKCGECHGTGRVRKKSTLKVHIPAGIDHRSTLKLSGKGEAGIKGGVYGDLYILVVVQDSKDFVRKGNDIYTEKEITVTQAVLGDEIPVRTVHGNVKLKIPAGTQSHKTFKMSNYGMPILNTDRKGHHYVKVIVVTPTKLSKKERELFTELAEHSSQRIKQTKEGFFSKIIG